MNRLISEISSHWLQSPKKVPNYYPEYYLPIEGSDLAPFFGDWSQSEKLSEIKQPLVNDH